MAPWRRAFGRSLERQVGSCPAVGRKALELDPASAAAHYNLAASLARRGDFAAAERHFRAALESEPDTRTYTRLGIVLWQQGRVDEAVARLNDAIETDPRNGAAYDRLGTIQLEQGELEVAGSTYRRLLLHQPSAAGHHELARILMRLGRTDEARREMEMANAFGGASGNGG